MSAALVNGYILVSSPNLEAVYKGPDRAPWELVDDDYYMGRLPPTLRAAYESMRSDEARGLWWVTCKELAAAIPFAEFERERGRSVELLAVRSPYLANSQDRQEWEEPRAIFSGVDIISVGEWSLLRIIQESRHPACDDLRAIVNDAGLLPDPSSAHTIERKYRELARANIVEPIAEPDSGLVVETVEVYALKAR